VTAMFKDESDPIEAEAHFFFSVDCAQCSAAANALDVEIPNGFSDKPTEFFLCSGRAETQSTRLDNNT